MPSDRAQTNTVQGLGAARKTRASRAVRRGGATPIAHQPRRANVAGKIGGLRLSDFAEGLICGSDALDKRLRPDQVRAGTTAAPQVASGRLRKLALDCSRGTTVRSRVHSIHGSAPADLPTGWPSTGQQGVRLSRAASRELRFGWRL